MRLGNITIWLKAALLASVALTCQAPAALGDMVPGATIYYGNDAQLSSGATDPLSVQGFTQLRDRWTTAGIPTTITDVFSDPIEGCIFLATAPTTEFSASQVSALQTFVDDGGIFIISHDGSPAPAMNQVLSDLGSSMQFGAIQGGATQQATVVNDSHPFMAGLSVGDHLYTYSPGTVTGGTALIDYPVGTPIVSVESVGLGTVMAVADFDMLNNVVGSYFPNDAVQDNNIVFWDGIAAAACQIPEPSTLFLACSGIAGLVAGRRRRRSRG